MNIISEATSGLKSSAPSADTGKERRLREACAGFEAIMLQQILALARRSVPEGGLLDGGYGEEMFRSMHDDQLARKMAGSGGLGFGEMLYRQLSAHLDPSVK
jgi:peptidoglycan hydrolase FlgJ